MWLRGKLSHISSLSSVCILLVWKTVNFEYDKSLRRSKFMFSLVEHNTPASSSSFLQLNWWEERRFVTHLSQYLKAIRPELSHKWKFPFSRPKKHYSARTERNTNNSNFLDLCCYDRQWWIPSDTLTPVTSTWKLMSSAVSRIRRESRRDWGSTRNLLDCKKPSSTWKWRHNQAAAASISLNNVTRRFD